MKTHYYTATSLDGVIVTPTIRWSAGKPLLPRSITNQPLRLVSAHAMGTGTAELRCEVPETEPARP